MSSQHVQVVQRAHSQVGTYRQEFFSDTNCYLILLCTSTLKNFQKISGNVGMTDW